MFLLSQRKVIKINEFDLNKKFYFIDLKKKFILLITSNRI